MHIALTRFFFFSFGLLVDMGRAEGYIFLEGRVRGQQRQRQIGQKTPFLHSIDQDCIFHHSGGGTHVTTSFFFVPFLPKSFTLRL